MNGRSFIEEYLDSCGIFREVRCCRSWPPLRSRNAFGDPSAAAAIAKLRRQGNTDPGPATAHHGPREGPRIAHQGLERPQDRGGAWCQRDDRAAYRGSGPSGSLHKMNGCNSRPCGNSLAGAVAGCPGTDDFGPLYLPARAILPVPPQDTLPSPGGTGPIRTIQNIVDGGYMVGNVFNASSMRRVGPRNPCLPARGGRMLPSCSLSPAASFRNERRS